MTNRTPIMAGGLLGAVIVVCLVVFARPLAELLLRSGLSYDVVQMFARSRAVQLALGVAMGSLAFFLTGFLMPALALRTGLTRAATQLHLHGNLKEALDSGALDGHALTDQLSGQLIHALETDAPAVSACLRGRTTPAALIEAPLAAPLFRLLPWMLGALGGLVSLVVLVKGLEQHVQAQSIFIQQVTDPMALAWLTSLSVMLLLLAAATGIGCSVALLRQSLETRRLQLIAEFDRLAPDPAQDAIRLGFTQIAAAQEATLAPAVDAIRKAMRAISTEQTKEVKHVAEALIGQFAGQMQAVVAPQGGASSQAIDELRAFLADQAQGIAAMHDKAVALLGEAADRSVRTADVLEAAVSREQVAANRISQSAEQMQAAAIASRETVERFIALAERMRDLSRAIGAAPPAPSLPTTLVPALGDDGPGTDPQMAKRLSTAIRELQRAADTGLPELR